MFGISSSEANRKSASFSRLRLLKDLADLNSLPSICQVAPDDPADVSHLTVTISPDEGLYKGGRFVFSVIVSDEYPFSPPKVKCTQIIYHPNIDLNGNVCLNILREDWQPMLSIETIVIGLVFLFKEPNPHDPLNHDAAAVYNQNIDLFKSNVEKTMVGRTVDNIKYDNVLI
ncbi:unnamed protein product [Adineta ricciae]|uniref:UBC core domain-containing protein n=1 Tax=Adineta ricciae TaxID=249248 RepID=A0A816CMS1_ADIRI|nr:unnamed protein product [Adineta ricciae]CAF1625517.1 unnamed protein product [Adineta ricciae]